MFIVIRKMNWKLVAEAMIGVGIGITIYNALYYHSPEYYQQVIKEQQKVRPLQPRKISVEEACKAHENYYRCKSNNLPISEVDKQIINDFVDYSDLMFHECLRRGGMQCTWFPVFDRVK